MHARERQDIVLRYQLGQRLLELQDGDVGSLVEQAVKLDHYQRTLIGLQDGGRVAIAARRSTSLGPAIERYRLDPDQPRAGAYPTRERVVAWLEGESVGEWVDKNQDAFDWLVPRFQDG